MEIYVKGQAKTSFKPDEVKMDFSFTKKAENYQNVLEQGCKGVESFIEFLVESLGFNKKDCKTSSFSVRENRIYNEKTKSYMNDGFVFMQGMTLSYDYDVKRFADVLEKLSKREDAPNCRIVFGLKDIRKAENELLEACIKDAKEQAEMIANASKLKLTKCEKVNCQPIYEIFESPTRFEKASACSYKGVGDSIQNTFVPEDIEVSNTLFVIWQAE